MRGGHAAFLSNYFDHYVAWRSGNVVGRIKYQVLGWVTVFGGQTTSVFHQATQANSASYPQRDGK